MGGIQPPQKPQQIPFPRPTISSLLISISYKTNSNALSARNQPWASPP
jgi:hypothetical protein